MPHERHIGEIRKFRIDLTQGFCGQKADASIVPEGRQRLFLTVPFSSNCGALNQVVKAGAGPEIVDRQIGCLTCSAPLVGRERPFVRKYFLPWGAVT
jgi:hypothetical protein